MLAQQSATTGSRFNLSTLEGAVIAALAILAFVYFGGPAALGAHPRWGMKIAYLAIASGLVMLFLATLASRRWQFQLITFSTLLIISIAITTYGKTQFAASYAEDDFAGKLWFFGWVGALAASFSIITAVGANYRQRNRAISAPAI
ncbi:hypothetical protein [Pseudomonas sp. M30-35]|uniref:hypothetical protein n=1 Tax=Pseudomonas sp. M30-35 TaxID=1981174 RepID=UPI000B3BF3B4|nr:hypothetical protein [Pseudomonas sp. M30-35]ARU88671.1 hypothetical protein B9K09_12155 [Pseudomonas sp. M30-35]